MTDILFIIPPILLFFLYRLFFIKKIEKVPVNSNRRIIYTISILSFAVLIHTANAYSFYKREHKRTAKHFAARYLNAINYISYFDFNVKTTKSVDIAVIDDIEYDDEWLCKVWGKCLYDLFGEEDMELSFYTGLYNIFTTLDEKERLKELNYISHCPASHIKIGESKFRNLALLSYRKGCCGGRVELPFGSYKYRPAAREKVDEMERQLKAYCEDLKNS